MLAVAGSVSIGIVGALALASPAQAHHSNISAEASCPAPEDDVWQVRWTITSWVEQHHSAETYEITHLSEEVPGIPLNEPQSMDVPFTGVQVLPIDVESVQLTVTTRWDNGQTSTDTSTVVYRPDNCFHEPTVESTIAVSCDLLVVAFRNLNSDSEVTFGIGADRESVHGPVEDADQVFELPRDIGLDQFVVASLPDDIGIADPQDYQPGDAAGPDAPLGIGEAYAHGIELVEGMEIVVGFSAEGEVGGPTITWAEIAEALDCPGEEETDDKGTGGGDDELPVTGSPTLWIAGAAVALLVIGGGLFFVARRRGVSFTA